MGQFEVAKIQAVETNQPFVSPDPEIAIGGLCDGRYRSARPTSLSSPRVVEILPQGPSGIERKRRNSEADACEPGNGTFEQPAVSKTTLTVGIQTSQPRPRLASA